MHVNEFYPEEQGFRYVQCFCKKSKVVTRREPAFDIYAVCSRPCFDDMVRAGKSEPGTLMREVV